MCDQCDSLVESHYFTQGMRFCSIKCGNHYRLLVREMQKEQKEKKEKLEETDENDQEEEEETETNTLMQHQ